MYRQLWLGLLLLLTACRLMIAPQLPAQPVTTEAGGCIRSHPERQLLLNGLHGYCVQ